MKMRLGGVVLVLLAITTAAGQSSRLYTRPELPSEEMLERLNLTLAWHTRLAMDGLRDGLVSLQLVPTKTSFQFIVQTRRGAVVALDAETGDLLWQTQVGQPYWPGQPVAYNSHALYVTRREFLYALERSTGKQQFESADARTRQRRPGFLLADVPSAAPVANERMLYIPFGTHVVALDLPYERAPRSGLARGDDVPPDEPFVAWNVKLFGVRVDQPLVLAGPSLGAVSPSGAFLSLSSQEPSEPLLFKTGATAKAALGQYESSAYLGSENGNIYALNIGSADLLWSFNAEAPILRKPAVTAKDVFVSPERVGLFRLDRKTGAALWLNRDAEQFLAVGKDFVYARDRLDRFLVLDYVRGTTLARYDLRDYTIHVENELTDRIYLASNDGRIICLRHRGQTTPLLNKLPPPPVKKKAPQVKPPAPKEKEDAGQVRNSPRLRGRLADADQCARCGARSSTSCIGSLTVNFEPLPTTLSTRMRPWCCSMICRQTLRPRPLPPWPFSSGSLVV
jgi:outer membrane protein assembly factor BamB